jgi:hypothetical protein
VIHRIRLDRRRQHVELLTNARNVLSGFIQYVPFWVIFMTHVLSGGVLGSVIVSFILSVIYVALV